MRIYELDRLSGSAFYVLGGYFTALVTLPVYPHIFNVSLLFLGVGDPIAAVVGSLYTRSFVSSPSSSPSPSPSSSPSPTLSSSRCIAPNGKSWVGTWFAGCACLFVGLVYWSWVAEFFSPALRGTCETRVDSGGTEPSERTPTRLSVHGQLQGGEEGGGETSGITGECLPQLTPLTVVVGAVASALTEMMITGPVRPRYFDDNLTIPLVSALVMRAVVGIRRG